MGARWDPYPGECGERDFLDEAAALEPLSVNEEAPAQDVWGHLFAAVVELGPWGHRPSEARLRPGRERDGPVVVRGAGSAVVTDPVGETPARWDRHV
ncbi:hypothetical protein ACFYW9_22685 [Streptomyces sp. NPDC002698]|uniref:hypothetical protein n=1 Tax=Streptomyces sp. NPDC002698 TaxID=3364660 RepID=UPI0036C33314